MTGWMTGGGAGLGLGGRDFKDLVASFLHIHTRLSRYLLMVLAALRFRMALLTLLANRFFFRHPKTFLKDSWSRLSILRVFFLLR